MYRSNLHSSLFRIQKCIFFKLRNFWITSSSGFGNCFTFNSLLNGDDVFGGERVTSMTGPSFGLNLIVDLQQGAYMKKGQTKQVSWNPTLISLCIEIERNLSIIGWSTAGHSRFQWSAFDLWKRIRFDTQYFNQGCHSRGLLSILIILYIFTFLLMFQNLGQPLQIGISLHIELHQRLGYNQSDLRSSDNSRIQLHTQCKYTS